MIRKMSEFQVKLAAVKEYEEAIKFKRAYEELAGAFMDLIDEALRNCEKDGLTLSKRDRYLNLLEKAGELVRYRLSLSPNDSERGEFPNGNPTEPNRSDNSGT